MVNLMTFKKELSLINWEDAELSVINDAKTKFDVITDKIHCENDLTFTIEGYRGFELTDSAFNQVTSRFTTGGGRWLSRLAKGSLSDRELVAKNINRGIALTNEKRGNSEYLVRTRMSNGTKKIRAILTDGYATLDNDDLLLEVRNHLGIDHQVARLNFDDNNFEVMVINQANGFDVNPKVGDDMFTALIISNSETGHGALSSQLGTYRLVCLNGMILPKYISHVKRVHRGDTSELFGFFNNTLKMSSNMMGTLPKLLEESRAYELPRHTVPAVIQMIEKDGKWSADFTTSVTNQSFNEEASKFGIIQAITHTAKLLPIKQRNEQETYAGSLLYKDFNRFVHDASKALPLPV